MINGGAECSVIRKYILYNLQKYLYKTLDKLKREEYIKLIKKKYQGRVLGYGP